MNAPPRPVLAHYRARLVPTVAALALALVLPAALAACGGFGARNQTPPPIQSPASTGADRHCADLFMQNVVSAVTVPGVFACQDTDEQARAQQAGVTDDSGIHDALSTSGALSFIGADGQVFAYAISDPSIGVAVWVIWTDPDGKIAHFSYTNPH